MATWRMAMKVGTGGTSLWRNCLELGVAAITYEPLSRTDLSKYPPGEPRELWAKLRRNQPRSFRAVVYEMRAGDTIYVKDGASIICRGTITGPYSFDSAFRIIDEHEVPWPHQVPVAWDTTFAPFAISVGRQQPIAVERLSSIDVARLEKRASESHDAAVRVAAAEGDAVRDEALFRVRNHALIHLKKVLSDYRCEVCSFHFESAYGEIGREHIIAHHLEPVARGPRLTSLKDIALLCANCHAMAHTSPSPLPLAELRARLRRPS